MKDLSGFVRGLHIIQSQYNSLPNQRPPSIIRRLDKATRQKLEREEQELKEEQADREHEEKLTQEALNHLKEEEKLAEQ